MASFSSACQPKIKDDFQMLTKLPTSSRAKTGLGKLLSGMYSKPTKKTTSVQEQTENEIKRYVDEEPPDIDINPLTWWKMHHLGFQGLQHLLGAIFAFLQQAHLVKGCSQLQETLLLISELV